MMRIPFQDTRSGSRRRWTDVVNIQKMRFNDLCDLIDRCEDLTKEQLINLHQRISCRLEVDDRTR